MASNDDVVDLISDDEELDVKPISLITPPQPSSSAVVVNDEVVFVKQNEPSPVCNTLTPLKIPSLFDDDDDIQCHTFHARPADVAVSLSDSDDSDDDIVPLIDRKSDIQSLPRPASTPLRNTSIMTGSVNKTKSSKSDVVSPSPSVATATAAAAEKGFLRERIEEENPTDALVKDAMLPGDFEPSLHHGDAGDASPDLNAHEMQKLLQLNRLSSDATRELPTPTEMNVLLLKHQRQALAWMVEREADDKPAGHPRGGILADDQGFGKTISTIALMLTNRPPMENGKFPAWGNLIVVPASILYQWAAEIEDHIDAEYRPKVLVYHGANRPRDPYVLVKYDVVLTSYAMLTQEYPKVLERETQDTRAKLRAKGPLFQLKWFRIILDEAQAIKNFRRETFKAATKVKAVRKWSLTGTPIQNTINDIYSQFLFLGYHVTQSYKEWDCTFKKPLEGRCSAERRETLFKQFQTILGVVLLRRAKNDKIDGKSVIQLPARKTSVMELQFSKTELQYYQAQEKTALERLRDIHENGVSNGFAAALYVLLRLRQACGHPALCEWGLESEFRFSDEELDVVDIRMRTRSMFRRLPQVVQDRLYVELGPGSEVVQMCPICFEPIEADGTVTKCGHLFCTSDFESWNRENETCPTCRGQLGGEHDIMSLDGVRKEVHALARKKRQEEEGLSPDESKSEEVEKKSKLPSLEINFGGRRRLSSPMEGPRKRARRMESSSVSSDPDGENEETDGPGENEVKDTTRIRTSTKITAFMEAFRKIISTTDDKVLCFSQWTRMLDLVQVCIKSEGFEFVRLDGTMSLKERGEAVRMFQKRTKCRLFLISLNAGCTGLNLNVANRVFLLDSWWNPAVEDQVRLLEGPP